MRPIENSPNAEEDVSTQLHPMIAEEINLSSDGENPGIYSPPPHITARIYRNSTNRRRSSATSSRRNSMSSHHSGRSSRSAHGGPQSSHVAQHLRRASIIQDRKDKAANRNAHAEKVRLRAALNKATPRVVTNSEERALAAQQARERYLAQVKASCAMEVKRSKRVAEEQREKRAAEHLKLKEDIQEKFAEAEKRKAQLQTSQRRTRTISLGNGEGMRATTYIWKPRHDAEAAAIIQRAWVNRQRRLVIHRFLGLGLTVEAVEKTSFEEIGELLSREDVLSCTAKVLTVCGLTDKHNDDNAEKTAVRTFLSSFLILGHPAQVFNKEGEQEQDLIGKAKELFLSFNRLVENSPRGSTLTTQLAELAEAYSSFQNAFAAWKSNDASHIISTMVAQFVALEDIWQTVKDDKNGAVSEDYREGIQQNKALIIVRLKKLAGPEKAINLLKDALGENKKTRKKKEPILDSRPRATIAGEDGQVAATALAPDSAPDNRTNDSISTSKDSENALTHFETSIILPDNRTIVHELMINREYRIDLEPSTEKRDITIDRVKKALQSSIDAGTESIWIPAVAENIHKMLLSLFLKPDNSLRIVISETLDPSMIKKQIENGTFSYQRFFSFMDTVLPKLCSPARDAEVEKLVSNPSQDPIEQIARIHFVIKLLVIDHTNFLLMSSAPSILQHAEGWEQREFKAKIAAVSPKKTLQWWKEAATKASATEAQKRSMDSSTSITPPIKPQKVYMTGLVDLALGTNILSLEDVPETLELDTDRLKRIRSDTLRLILVASILLTAKNLMRRDVRSLWKNEAQRMWELPFSSPATAFVSIVESRYALPPTTKQQLISTINRLLIDAREGQTNHPVMKVLLKKIQTHVLARLSASSAEERIKTSTTATEALGSSGMPEFVSRIGEMVKELGRVADVDRSCHGQWYDEIVASVSEEEEEEQKQRHAEER